MYTITGSHGLTMEVEPAVYDRMRDRFTTEIWDESGDFDGADWFFEGRFEFEGWLYDELLQQPIEESECCA